MARRRINLRFLLILLIVGVLGAVALVGLKLYRDRNRATRAEEGKRIGLEAFEKENYETARTRLGHYLSAHPDDVDILWKYALAQSRCEEPSRQHIHSSLQKILLQDPDHWDAQQMQAQIYLNNVRGLTYRLETAPETLSSGQTQSLRHYRTQLEGLARRMFAQQSEAVDDFRDTHDPEKPLPETLRDRFQQATQLYMTALMQSDRAERAAEVLAEVNARMPGYVEAWFQRARLQQTLSGEPGPDYVATPYCRKAEALARQAMQTNPDAPLARIRAADLLADHTRWASEAVPRYRARDERPPEEVLALAARGYDEPVALIRKALEDSAGDLYPVMLRHEVTFWKKNLTTIPGALKKLMESARRRLEQTPSDTACRILLAQLLTRTNESPRALDICREGLEIEPDTDGADAPDRLRPELMALTVHLLTDHGRLDEARKRLDSLEAEAPESPYTAYARARLGFAENRYSDALEALDGLMFMPSSRLSMPGHWRLYAAELRIQSALRSNRPGLAVSHIEETMDWIGEPARTRLGLQLADLRLIMGRPKEAYATLQDLQSRHDLRLTEPVAGPVDTDEAKALATRRFRILLLLGQYELSTQARRDAQRRDWSRTETILRRLAEYDALLSTSPTQTTLPRIELAIGMNRLRDRPERIESIADTFDEIDNSEPQVAMRLARIETTIGRKDAARRRLTDILDNDEAVDASDLWRLRLLVANLTDDKDAFETHIDRLEEMVRNAEGPERIDRARLLAQVMAAHDMPQQRIEPLRQIVERAGADETIDERIFRLIESDRLDEARAAMPELRKAFDDDHPDRLLLEGMLLSADGKPAEAQPLLQKANDARPDWPLGLVALARVKTELARQDRARAMTLAVEQGDTGEAFRNARRSSEAFLGQALELLNRALEINPMNVRWEILRLRTARRLNDTLTAGKSFDRLVDRFGGHPDVLALRVDDRLRNNDLQAAVDLQRALLRQRPTPPNLLTLIALTERVGDYRPADALYADLRKELDSDKGQALVANPDVFQTVVTAWLRRPTEHRDRALDKARRLLDAIAEVLPPETESAHAAIALSRGRIAMAEGDLDAALTHFKAAHDRAPELPEPVLALADTLARRGDIDRGVETLNRFLEENPTAATVRFRLIDRAMGQPDALERARRLLEPLLESHPGDPAVLLRQARLELRSDNRAAGEAVKLLEKAVTIEPAFEPAVSLLAQLHISLERPTEAESVLDEGLRHRPGSAELRILRADVARRLNQPVRAVEILEEGLDRNPGNRRMILALAPFHRAIDPSHAVRYIERTLKDAGGNTPLRVGLLRELASIYRAEPNDPSRAIELLLEAWALDDSNPQLAAQLVGAMLAEGRFEQAKPYLDKALERWPRSTALRLQRLEWLVGLHRLAEADKAFDALVADRPDRPGLLLEYARRLNASPKPREVTERIERLCNAVLKEQPAAAGAHFILGDHYNRIRRREEAIRHYRAGLDKRMNPGVANNLAWLLYETEREDNREEALRLSKFAVDSVTDNGEFWDTRRAVLTWAGRRDDAAEAARRSVDLLPKPKFRLRLAEALARAGQKDEARTVAAALRQDEKSYGALTDDQRARLQGLLK